MKKIFKRFALVAFLPVIVFFIQSWLPVSKTKREFYQITIYHFSNANQEKMLDTYLQHALLPALHKMNIKNIGVFKPVGNDTAADKKIYVLIPFKSLDQFVKLPAKLPA